MAFRPMRMPAGRPTAEPHEANQLSGLYSRGRLPVSRHGHIAAGPNVHTSRPPPQALRSKLQDPAAQTQRFPFGGGAVPGSGGIAPSEPAEPHVPMGFDPTKPPT